MNWSLKYVEVLDSWTTPLEGLPRWFSANSYPTINTPILFPAATGIAVSGSIALPSDGKIPTSWVLSEHSTNQTSNQLQKLVKAFVVEFQSIFPLLQATFLSRCQFFDVSEPDFAWYLPYDQRFKTASIQLTDNSYQTIQPSISDLDLLYPTNWTYKQLNNEILVTGINLQEQRTVSGENGWQYITDKGKFNSTTIGFWKPVEYGTWESISPFDVTEGGFIGLKREVGNLYLRGFDRRISLLLDSIRLRLDSDDVVADRVNLWTASDEKGIFYSLKRLDGEDSENFGNKIIATSWFAKDQSDRNFTNAIGIALDQYSVTSVVPLATGYSKIGFRQFSTRNFLPIKTVLETNLTRVGTGYYSIYSNPIRGTAFINGNSQDIVNQNGKVTFLNYTPSTRDKVDVYWLLDCWTSTASGITLYGPTYQRKEPIDILSIKNIKVEKNITDDLVDAFQLWPGLEWQFSMANNQKLESLSTFD